MPDDFADLLKGTDIMPSKEISRIIQEKPSLQKKLRMFHPIKSAALISGLLTLPDLHANTLRLEMMIHLIMSYSKGKKEPMAQDVYSWLNRELGETSFAFLEDPVEDVFISNVITDMGNIRIFEGVWGSSDFYLQKMIDIVNLFPDGKSLRQLKKEIRGILILSEEIAARRKLSRFVRGGGDEKGTVKIPSDKSIKELSKSIVFTQKQILQLEITPEDIEPFLFNIEAINKLREGLIEGSDLQQHPIIEEKGKWFVLLPSCISFAVKIHILNWMLQHGYQDDFDNYLVAEYRKFLYENIGNNIGEMPLEKTSGKYIMSLVNNFDTGRYLQVIAVIDSISGYQRHGFLSQYFEDEDECSAKIKQYVNKAQTYCCSQDDFKKGLTLIIGCGYGRPAGFRAVQENKDWLIEYTFAPDFQTLFLTNKDCPSTLLKMISQARVLDKESIDITNANGLLNLYGWWIDTKYFMIPSDVKFGDRPLYMAIPTDSLTDVRVKTRQGWDIHALPLINGKIVKVRRKTFNGYFPNNENQPLYGCIESIQNGQLLGAWVGNQAIWWVLAESRQTGLSRELVFKVWDAVHNWLKRIVPVLEHRLHKQLDQVIQIVLDFDDVKKEITDFISEQISSSGISILVEKDENSIFINFYDSFFSAFHTSRNIAERMIIREITKAVYKLAGEEANEKLLGECVDAIVPNDDARYFHMLNAVRFRDQINSYHGSNTLFIDEADEAMSKLGLGWLVSENNADSFNSIEDSTKFLNSVIEIIWKRMRVKFHSLNRIHFIETALRYIEGVEFQKLEWQRTIRAVIALSDDPESVNDVVVKQLARCNASTLALRLLIEMAISECPLKEGKQVGILDLTPLMSDVLYIFNFGGISDAIKKGVMEPEVKIAANGDILTHTHFQDKIISPFGEKYGKKQLDYEKKRYEKHYESSQPVPTMENIFSDEFLAAFKVEFKISIDSLRGIRDMLEDLAIEKKDCVFIAEKNTILNYCNTSEFTTKVDVEIFLNQFSNFPREAWEKTPKGFSPRDWYPWLFGRALSLVARPVIQLENIDNPRYFISPGLVSDGIMHTIAQYFEAEIPTDRCRTAEMKRWIDNEKARQSHAFVTEVADVMKKLGYEVRIEIAVTELINEKTPNINYGDVDVLAWRKDQDEILAIECKDLKLTKTPNEIAEQLNHFSGQILGNGKRDELRKHIDRCVFLNSKMSRISKTLGMDEHNIHVRNIVCFSKPNPTQYMESKFPDIRFFTVDDLQQLKCK